MVSQAQAVADRFKVRLIHGATRMASFGAYILHPAIVVAPQAVMTDVLVVAFAKFMVVPLLGTVAAFAVAHVASRVPGISAVLGATSGREASLLSGARMRQYFFRN